MKTNFFKSSLATMAAVAMFLGFIFTSCDSDTETSMSPTSTITDVVVANPNFSLLKSAVVKANLATTLSGPGPFTVFAPDNNAFAASGISSATINALSSEQLQDILLYHTLPAKIVSVNVPAGPNAEVVTAGGGKVYVTKNTNGVFVNGWKVTAPDIVASNGVIHALEHVLLPPTGNIVATAQANNDLTYLVAAVLRASQGSTDVAAALSGGGPLTVFAPTNQAFIAAGFPTIASIEAADPDVLANILTYHVVTARAFSSDLSDGQNLTTLNGGQVTVSLVNGAAVKGNGNTTASNITAVNIMADNGVIHLIDRVLLP
ncbi:fasciclin domain-containing protein [Flavobacterium supellecticarium]|uniref:Fasciclin domain-containing protein n=1 Tax=Flavobacterium supellecticarium TaxID=2565924 RepID=A0A4S3ZTW8_9FLAO|nr:fasciclin domain-containing protein [Flavobacterium supellecticarium]THF49182.1 fasciclin domain-containing protein [Flavobacterium supellecticarium]